jgi:hypothetical protein
MKKIIITGVLTLGVLGGAACDEEPTAELIVYNCLGYQDPATCTGGSGEFVAALYLSGEEDTGNLLGVVLGPKEIVNVSDKVLPGKYKWRVEYSAEGGLASNYDCAEEFELYPGVNNLKLKPCAGGLGGSGL